jgi:hyperosmotically inducible protein
MLKIKSQLLAVAVAFLMAASTGMAAGNTNTKDDVNLQTANQVRKQILRLPYYGIFDNIAFEVEGDTVTLSGQVLRPTTRSDAAKRVAKIEGVEKVVNNIEVLPLSRFDDSIRARTYRTVFNQANLYRYALGTNPSVHIIVKNGRVTLEGVVANQSDSNLFNIAANGVSGVFAVTNNLRVESGS